MNPYFHKIAQARIDFALSQSMAAGELSHNGLKGRAREIFAKDILSPFLSPNVEICTGQIVDSVGKSSRQTDIIIFDKTLIPSLMLSGEEGIVPVESVLGAIEIKSALNKEELRKAVEVSRSIKALSLDFREILIDFPDEEIEEAKKTSVPCYLFAFNSDANANSELERLRDIVKEFNDNNEQKVYIPISGMCIADTHAVSCKGYNCQNEIPVPHFEEFTEYPAIHFIFKMLDFVSIMECQRKKMLMSHYFING